VFAPEALDDLCSLYDLVADASAPERALAWVEALFRGAATAAAIGQPVH
jgi:plasmid stabilization system protein ParE